MKEKRGDSRRSLSIAGSPRVRWPTIIQRVEVLVECVAEQLAESLSGRCSGAADGFAIDDEFDAAIALAAFGGVVCCDWLRFAKAARSHRACGHPLFGEEI